MLRRVCLLRRCQVQAPSEAEPVVKCNLGLRARRSLGSFALMEEGVILRNRLAVATNVWRDHIREPLPKIPPGSPDEQIQYFEMTLVDRLAASATPSNANDVAERTWDIVHDRSDDDPVKVKVVALHSELVKLRNQLA